MKLTEKFDKATARMDELKAKAEKASAEIKASFEDGAADFKSDMAFNKSAVKEIVDEMEAEDRAEM